MAYGRKLPASLILIHRDSVQCSINDYQQLFISWLLAFFAKNPNMEKLSSYLPVFN